MDPEVAQVFDFVMTVLPWATAIIGMTVGGWVFTTWLRIKNGYPLENSWAFSPVSSLIRSLDSLSVVG